MVPGANDAGLANERTALAWQRTALSLGAAAAIMARLTWSSLGVAAIAPLLAALLLSGWVFVEGWLRYSHHAGRRGKQGPRGGRASLFLAIATALVAATKLATVVGV